MQFFYRRERAPQMWQDAAIHNTGTLVIVVVFSDHDRSRGYVRDFKSPHYIAKCFRDGEDLSICRVLAWSEIPKRPETDGVEIVQVPERIDEDADALISTVPARHFVGRRRSRSGELVSRITRIVLAVHVQAG
jgi:hypothetical protein